MLLTFRSCYEMFSAPVDQALGLKQGKTLDYNQAGTNLLGIVLKSCLLVLMAIVASMISSRGIHLYSRSLFTTAEAKKSDQ